MCVQSPFASDSAEFLGGVLRVRWRTDYFATSFDHLLGGILKVQHDATGVYTREPVEIVGRRCT